MSWARILYWAQLQNACEKGSGRRSDKNLLPCWILRTLPLVLQSWKWCTWSSSNVGFDVVPWQLQGHNRNEGLVCMHSLIIFIFLNRCTGFPGTMEYFTRWVIATFLIIFKKIHASFGLYFFVLNRGWANYGPRASCGSPNAFLWPAKKLYQAKIPPFFAFSNRLKPYKRIMNM